MTVETESTSSTTVADKQICDDNVVILDNDGKPRFLMQESGYPSYQVLTRTIGTIVDSKIQNKTIPPEIIRSIAVFFTTRRLDPKETEAIRASSTSGQYSLDQCLVDSESSWWISAFGSFRNGRGEEYIEFELGTTLKRLTAVHLCIPPLPRGPLSVRTMRLDCNAKATGEWRAATPILTVENKSGWQRFELPSPIDAQYIRVVCLTNQATRFQNEEAHSNDWDAVGFFTIKFE
jgi:hypothetical protein